MDYEPGTQDSLTMIKGIKGVKDILPEDTPLWQFIEQVARRWANLYGFVEIRIPIFEVTTLFARSIGSTTDIVEKEMYTFPIETARLSRSDRKGRPELFAPSLNTTVPPILYHKSISTSVRCFAMNVRRRVGCDNFISSAWSTSGRRMRRLMWM